jgi:hypothetical protein
MFDGCAPGVFTIDSRIWFQSITGWPESAACTTCLGATVGSKLSGAVFAYALAARTAAVATAPSTSPTANSRGENRFM